MTAKTGRGKIKKASRGMRKHVRRMKQDSRKTGIPLSEWRKKARSQPAPVPKKET